MSTSPDIIIVGAGIIGAACAAECARAGLKVLVLDRGPIAGGTTSAGMGHVVLMDDSEAQFALTNYSRQLWLALRPQLPPDIEFEPRGTLWVAADAGEMAEVHRKQKFYSARGIRVEVLDPAAVARAEPNLRPGLAGGLLVPDDCVVDPPSIARFFLKQATRHGAEVRIPVAVRELLPDGRVLLDDASRLSAGKIVNAAGPWSPALSAGLPVRKRKGHLVITDRYPGYVHHQIVELGYLKSAHAIDQDSVAFNIQPRRNGQLLIGSSRQFDADHSAVDQPILDRMMKRATEFLPTLGQLSTVRVWAGHRAASPDKLPIIGPSLQSDRIWLATGHEGLGITTSTGTGRLLADLILGRPSEIPTAPYLPKRFADTAHHEH
jgi:glycine/D-amino acid oxidase-like deaminating enzyme